MTKKWIRQLLPIGVLMLLSVVIILPYFYKGFFPSHDGEWAVVRLSEMFREIRDAQFPARYSTYLNFGHGYPLFNFAYPFPYYLGLPFVLSGFGYVNTIKLIFASTVPVSALGMYFVGKRLWENTFAAFIASILFIFVPYRFLDLYVRGSIGESIAFAIVPWLLFSGLKISEKKNAFWIGIFALLLAALLTAHNIMGLYFAPIVLTLISIKWVTEKNANWRSLATSTILGASAAAFFIFPALYEKQFIYLAEIPIADRSLYWVQPQDLLFSPWGYGTPTENDAFTYQIGYASIAALLLAGVILVKRMIRREQVKKDLFALAVLTTSLFLIFMMFSPSAILWENLPLLKEINYPWTLLGPLTFLAALAGGYTLKHAKWQRVLSIAFILLAIGTTLSYANPKEYVDRGEGYYTTNDATTTSSREYTPLWVKELPLTRPEKGAEIVRGEGEVSVTSHKSNEIIINYTGTENSLIRINTIYYPGWRIDSANGELFPGFDNPRGLMEFEASGKGTVRAFLKEPPYRQVANLITLVAIITSILFLIKGVYQWKK